MKNDKTEIFVEKAIKIHGKKYNYSLVDYINAHSKIIIICPIHGEFLQKPNTHLNGAGCKQCGIIKQKNTIREVYGVENISQSSVIKKRKKDTLIKNYGVDHNFKSDIVKENRKKTWIERYGVDNPRKSDSVKEKMKQTCIERYGVDNPAKSEEIKNKMYDVFMKKYGVNTPSKKHYSKELLEKLYSYEWLYEEHHIKEKSIFIISKELNIWHSTLKRYYDRNNIPVKNYGSSYGEIQLQNFIRENIECIFNDRKLISPSEVDVYVPSKNIAIEFHGIYWHSDKYKSDNYHMNKYLKCKENNVNLIQIFEDEWNNKTEIVKFKLLNILGLSCNRKIKSSECYISKVSNKEKQEFYNLYDISGDVNCKINLGLYYQKELVACMGFSNKKNRNYELMRYTTKYDILDGFSKLLNYFKLNYAWDNIIKLVDLRWNDEELYEINGFIIEEILPPDYSYVINNKRIDKSKVNESEIEKIFLQSYDPEKTEFENMENIGILKIYDCGRIKFKLTRTA